MAGVDDISAVATAFFGAFTNGGGSAPVDVLYDICLPDAVVVNATSAPPSVYTLRDFVEPRRKLLESGDLRDFREYEVSHETFIHGRIAHRTSRYEKVWFDRTGSMHGSGLKILSFVQMPSGWKIASVVWHDDV